MKMGLDKKKKAELDALFCNKDNYIYKEMLVRSHQWCSKYRWHLKKLQGRELREKAEDFTHETICLAYAGIRTWNDNCSARAFLFKTLKNIIYQKANLKNNGYSEVRLDDDNLKLPQQKEIYQALDEQENASQSQDRIIKESEKFLIQSGVGDLIPVYRVMRDKNKKREQARLTPKNKLPKLYKDRHKVRKYVRKFFNQKLNDF
jgi:DNA-directed RNA polymerase specialized sigma24 family protein